MGGIDFAEDPEQAMIREVFEETGLNVRARGIVATDSLVKANADHRFHAIRLLYDATLVGGELRPEVSGSTDACAWVPLAEVHDLPLVDLARVGVRRVLERRQA